MRGETPETSSLARGGSLGLKTSIPASAGQDPGPPAWVLDPKVEPWSASDHYISYLNGVPSITLTSEGIRDIYHTLSDTLEWITREKLAESVQLVPDLMEVLDNKDLAWSRP